MSILHPLSNPIPTPKKRDIAIISSVMFIICCGLSLFPGITPFICDEPNLIRQALDANQAHQLADHGLAGSKAFHYGPAPVWLYQLLLGMTHNILNVIFIKCFIFSNLCAISLVWLYRLTTWPVWFAFVPMLSPYFWIYDRLLWDNTLLMPLGILAMVCCASFLQQKNRISLFICIIAIGLMLLVHPMCLPLVAAIIIYSFCQPKELWRGKWVVVISIILVSWTASSYISFALKETPRDLTGATNPNGWWFPLLGARLLSATDLSYFFQTSWAANIPQIIVLPVVLTYLAYLAAMIGFLGTIYFWIKPTSSTSIATRALTRISVIAILLQIPYYGLSHTFGHPHHHNALWPAYVILMWYAFLLLSDFTFTKYFAIAYVASLLFVTVFVVNWFYINHGSCDERIGTCIADQIGLMNVFKTEDPTWRFVSNVRQFDAYPQSLEIIRRLQNLPPADPNSPVRVLVIYQYSPPNAGILK